MVRVFDYECYVEFLSDALSKGNQSRGRKAKLARHLGCQTSFISQVLSGKTHLSFEHGYRVTSFMAMNEDESDYFMLLLQTQRAGTTGLQQYYQKKRLAMQRQHSQVKSRIPQTDYLDRDAQSTYYSMWWYAAIHICVALPEFDTAKAIALRLKLPLNIVEQCLQFLLGTGLVKENAGQYTIGKERIHLPSDSPCILRHHINWREKMIAAYESSQSDDLHYTATIGISMEAANEIRKIMLDSIEKSEKLLQESKEEAAFVMLLDFFRLA